MKQLTKVQMDAIVDEVYDMLDKSKVTLTKSAETEWAKIQAEIAKHHELEIEENRLDEEMEKVREASDAIEKVIRKKVDDFEAKHTLEVNWRYVDYDEGEVPSVKFPAGKFSEKIRRQIAIASIDKEISTADDLIQTIFSKFEKN